MFSSSAQLSVMLCVAAACTSATDEAVRPNPSPPDPPPTVDTVFVESYGARGDDEVDDAAAFARALAALAVEGGVLRVGVGTYVLTASGDRPRRGFELSGRKNIAVVGDGIGSTTIMLAPGNYTSGGDTHLVFLEGADGITFRDLTLDGNLRGSTWSARDEHRHCVAIWSPSSNLVFERVRFYNCRGDGLFLVGSLTGGQDWIDGVRVEHSVFEDNGRSGIAVQRGVRRLEILHSSFARISDQSIDLEPTGAAGGRSPTDVRIEHNTFQHGRKTLTVTLTGIAIDDQAHRIVFAHNRIEQGALQVHNADDVVIRDNVIVGDPYNHPVTVQKNSTNVRIISNELTGAASVIGGVIQLMNHNGYAPSGVLIEDNEIRATGDLGGIFAQDVADVRVRGNVLHGSGHQSGIRFSTIQETGQPRHGFDIAGNTIKNFTIGMQFGTRNDPFAAVTVQENTFTDDQPDPTQQIGIIFDKTGPYESFATISRNHFGRGIKQEIMVKS